MALSANASADDEETKKVYFSNYANAFLDAKEQRKYISCLEEDRHAKDFRRNHRDAERWMKQSQAETEKYQAFFPPDKQISDAEETFADISDKIGSRRIVITLRDGTQTVLESQFDKAAH